MMLKIFEFIYNNPKEFGLFLSISLAVVYTVIRIFKGIFSLFFKSKKRNEQAKQRELQADIVIDKLGGVDGFTEYLASKITEKIQPNIQEIEQELDKLIEQDKCPVELKAYIETVLKASPNLLLNYEELKLKYKANSLPKVVQKAKDVKDNTQEKTKEQTREQTPVKVEKQENKQEDITYA